MNAFKADYLNDENIAAVDFEMNLEVLGGFSSGTQSAALRLMRNDALVAAGVSLDADEDDANTSSELRAALYAVSNRAVEAFNAGQTVVEYDDVADLISEKDYFNFFELIAESLISAGYNVSAEATSDFALVLEEK